MINIYINYLLLIILFNAKWKGLFIDDEQKIEKVKRYSRKRIFTLSVFAIGALLVIQHQEFGWFGAASLYGASMIMYLIIFFETLEAVACLFFKESYIQIVASVTKFFFPTFKLIAIAECAFLGYLFIQPIIQVFTN